MADPTPTTPAAGTGGAATSDEYGPIKMMRAWPADRDDDSPPDASALSRALAVHDALPDVHRPSDHEPLRNCLPGIWPTVGDLRAMLASDAAPASSAAPDLPAGGAGLPTVEEPRLRDALVAAGVDTPVANEIVGARHDDQHAQPAWLWYDHDHGRYSFGRWPKVAGSAPYVRGDIVGAILARLAERRPAAGVDRAGDGWEGLDTCPSNGESVWVWRSGMPAPTRREADGEYWRRRRDDGGFFYTHWCHDWVPTPPSTSTGAAP